MKPRLLFNKIIFKLSRSLFEFKFYNIIARLQLGQEISISHEEHLKNLYIISSRTRPGGVVRPGMTSVFLTTISSKNEDKTSNIFPKSGEKGIRTSQCVWIHRAALGTARRRGKHIAAIWLEFGSGRNRFLVFGYYREHKHTRKGSSAFWT